MQTFQKKHFFVLIALLVLVLAGSYGYYASAVVQKNVPGTFKTTRYRLDYTDIIAGTDLALNPQYPSATKRVKLLTLAGGGQILSAVSNGTVGFTGPSVNDPTVAIYPVIDMIHADDPVTHAQLAPGDVWAPTNLANPVFDNRLGSTNGFAFYDETNPVDIDLYISSSDGMTSLNNLTAGSIDFYITGTL